MAACTQSHVCLFTENLLNILSINHQGDHFDVCYWLLTCLLYTVPCSSFVLLLGVVFMLYFIIMTC